MKEYIRRDKLLEARKHAIHVYENANILNAEGIRTALKPLLDVIVDIPATDVKEVIYGKWAKTDFGIICSACGRVYDQFEIHSREVVKFKFCPECGAIMYVEDEDNE